LACRIFDASGKLLTKTIHRTDTDSTFTPVLPFFLCPQGKRLFPQLFSGVFLLLPEKKYSDAANHSQNSINGDRRLCMWTDDCQWQFRNETDVQTDSFFHEQPGIWNVYAYNNAITCDFGKYFSGVNIH
jgi:alpha-D-xyloside xylohydrolase